MCLKEDCQPGDHARWAGQLYLLGVPLSPVARMRAKTLLMHDAQNLAPLARKAAVGCGTFLNTP